MTKKQYDRQHITRIIVTKHALQRYSQRVSPYIDEERVKSELKYNAKYGKVTHLDYSKTGSGNDLTMQTEYNGVGITSTIKGNSIVIVTCTGTSEYRKWYKHQNRLAQRYSYLLHTG